MGVLMLSCTAKDEDDTERLALLIEYLELLTVIEGVLTTTGESCKMNGPYVIILCSITSSVSLAISASMSPTPAERVSAQTYTEPSGATATE